MGGRGGLEGEERDGTREVRREERGRRWWDKGGGDGWDELGEEGRGEENEEGEGEGGIKEEGRENWGEGMDWHPISLQLLLH